MDDLDMDELLFSAYGVDILRRAERLFIRYDGGHFNIEMVENEITEQEAEKVTKSERDAYEVIIVAQNRG